MKLLITRWNGQIHIAKELLEASRAPERFEDVVERVILSDDESRLSLEQLKILYAEGALQYQR